MKLNSPVSNLVVGYFGSMEIQQPDIILRAVHRVISRSWVGLGPTIVIVIWVDSHCPLGSKSKIQGENIWADSLKNGWRGHLVERRCLGVTCWFWVTKSKRNK